MHQCWFAHCHLLVDYRRSRELRRCSRRDLSLHSLPANWTLHPDSVAALICCQTEDQQTESAHLGRKRSEEHTSELQSPCNLVCRLLLEKKKDHAHTPLSTAALNVAL